MGRFFAILGFVFLFAGCVAPSQTVTVPRLPAWRSVANNSTVTPAQVRARLAAELPGIPVNMADGVYTVVSHAWLEEYLGWTWEVARGAGIVYTPESFDCDDFALGFSLMAARAAARADVRAAPLVARLVVRLADGKRHELIGVATERGLYVVEPQPDAGPFRVWALRDYPERILSVTLGDFNP